MAFWSPRFLQHLRHALESFVWLLLLTVFAVAFTYLEDWMHEHQRPTWLVLGAQGLSILAFVADGIVFAGICIKLIIEAVKDLWKR